MNAPSAPQGLDQARDLLSAHLAVPASAVTTVPALCTPRLAAVDIAEHRFTLAWTASGAVGPIARAIELLQDAGATRASIALVVTPYLGEAGAARCEAANVGWLDLCGNASIRGPGLRIQVRSHPNHFARRGRPANPFAPKSARVARWLLMHPHTAWRQRALADSTGLSEGAVSKVVRAYAVDGAPPTRPMLTCDGARRAAEVDRGDRTAGA